MKNARKTKCVCWYTYVCWCTHRVAESRTWSVLTFTSSRFRYEDVCKWRDLKLVQEYKFWMNSLYMVGWKRDDWTSWDLIRDVWRKKIRRVPPVAGICNCYWLICWIWRRMLNSIGWVVWGIPWCIPSKTLVTALKLNIVQEKKI